MILLDHFLWRRISIFVGFFDYRGYNEECIERGREILNLSLKAARLHMMKAVFMSMAAISAFVWRAREHTLSKRPIFVQKSLRYFQESGSCLLTFVLFVYNSLDNLTFIFFKNLTAVCWHFICLLFWQMLFDIFCQLIV